MFSTGQIVFAVLFIITFFIIIVIMYRKDLKLHQKNYKGVKWVGIFFIIFIFILFSIKYLLNN
ncbi:hypothetical protein CJ263_02275 [Maribacter cobaltidurans]|uniref:Uncharacterized protein n=1 Tax=Maribacter cobaltidurans TaxID=1178778 RepID=A0A223V111_9FLAO|nr:hypothetical protein CJ263_02275 [Maribacter cobaltidurans]